MEMIYSSETSVLARDTLHHIPEDGILQDIESLMLVGTANAVR
jgi:hypothetical protein